MSREVATASRKPLILPHHGCTPELAPDVFVAPSADLIGEVTIGAQSSVWFQVVIRGDVNWIKIGRRKIGRAHV